MPTDITPVLHATGISKFFPGVIALDDVELTLYPGEVHGLLGENGAGKSTLIKCLTGAYARDGGKIELDGVEISPRDPLSSQEAGIGTVYQEVNLLPNLSVAENLFLGRQPRRFGMIDQRRMVRDARTILSEYGLDIDPARLLSSYSIAVQQIVAIARAVELSGKVLILDEPTASLDRDEVQLMFSVIRRLTGRGLAVVFITHFLDQVQAICDRATILRNGCVVGTLKLAEASRTEIVTMMLGRQLEEVTSRADRGVPGDVLLSLEEFGRRGSIEPFSMEIREGEVVGLAGLLGSGRSETCNAVFGADPADRGEARLRGDPLRLSNPRAAIRHRFALCPEDRKTDGIVGDLSVRENIILSLQARQGWFRPLPRARIEEIAEHYVQALDIRLASLDTPIRLLSGGNQQKALLARWLATDPAFLILDEPTRGIDVGAHAEIIALIERLRADGMALLVASSEMEELVAYSTRVIVLRDRKQVGELRGDEISPAAIVRAIAAEEEEVA
ncbi:sugar ABC transporter ATP-binding protein [Thioclava atlantica]|uniref:Putative sugar ABC transporter, ATP-binding protein n=1 Tax=Thioclava atlantica TaxID=1317124 RepID=A0A085TXK6_9RHOB|nr:sugar ABC transporter ATP-binding protein [Thioclava atlantica]KFE35453.1 putative sugar ABC transporter, ATP-binding protein [Thioclava atlantica]